MRRATVLGLEVSTESDVPVLGEIPRTEVSIRTAVGRLGNPVQRLGDRLFWFHLAPQPQESEAPAEPAPVLRRKPNETARRHDEALRGLFAAFDAGLDDAGVAVWVRALRRWHKVVSEDQYWALTLSIEVEGAFEPAALPSEITALRDEAVGLAAEPLVAAARDALAREEIAAARRIMMAFGQLLDTGRWATTAQQETASLAAERVRALCRAFHEEYSRSSVNPRVDCEDGAAEKNKKSCDIALRRFRSELLPALDRVLRIVPSDHEVAEQSREEAALCLREIAEDYTWADDRITFEKLLEEALRMAPSGTLGAIRIECQLAPIREKAAAPAARRIRTLCRTYHLEHSSRVDRKRGDANHRNKTACDAALARFRSEIMPAVDEVLRLVDSDHEIAQQSRVPAAHCLREIAEDYAWADDFITCAQLLEEASKLASGTTGAVGIERQLIRMREASVKQQGAIWIDRQLKRMRAAPIKQRGAIRIERQLIETRGASVEQRAVGVPITSLPPLRTIKWIAATAIVGLILAIAITSSQSSSSASRPSTILVDDSATSPSRMPATSSGDEPAARSDPAPGTSSRYIAKDDASRSELADLNAQIESGRSQLEALQRQLTPVSAEVKVLDARMQTLSSELASLKAQQEAGVEIDLVEANAKVDEHNALLQERRALFAANKVDLQTRADLEQQDSILVHKYNALLRSTR